MSIVEESKRSEELESSRGMMLRVERPILKEVQSLCVEKTRQLSHQSVHPVIQTKSASSVNIKLLPSLARGHVTSGHGIAQQL